MDTGCKALLSLSISDSLTLSHSLYTALSTSNPPSLSPLSLPNSLPISLRHLFLPLSVSRSHTHYVFICWGCMTLTPRRLDFLPPCNAFSPYSLTRWYQQALMWNKKCWLLLCLQEKKKMQTWPVKVFSGFWSKSLRSKYQPVIVSPHRSWFSDATKKS